MAFLSSCLVLLLPLPPPMVILINFKARCFGDELSNNVLTGGGFLALNLNANSMEGEPCYFYGVGLVYVYGNYSIFIFFIYNIRVCNI